MYLPCTCTADPFLAFNDLLRVNTRDWRILVLGIVLQKEVPHMNDTKKTLGTYPTPRKSQSQEFKGARKKGYQRCLD